TAVNGVRVKEAFLKEGDVIRAGRTQLRFTVPSRVEAPAAAERVCVACGAKGGPGSPSSADATGSANSYLCERCRKKAREQPQPVPGYEIVRLLGEGSLGVVYLARHNDSGKLVALKLMVLDPTASPLVVKLFLSEVNALSQLDHPRIVRIRETGLA